MTLLDRLAEDIKAAMKSGDKLRTETLRLVRSQLKDVQIEKRRDLEPEEELAVLVAAAKKRREAIEAFEKAGRQDLFEKEKKELEMISAYLPQALTPDELKSMVDAVIQETGASGPGDLGKVMGKIMSQVKGRADGKAVQQMVRERLS